MSKLLSSVLDKVSENNNEYRIELKSLNKKIDEKTTALVGDIVTLSNYTIDFSNAIQNAKEMLIGSFSRVIESYVIKDLRSVESVNEQFVEKINDKIENANITSPEEKDAFIENLNSLLNDKYLEIVRIKRVDFTSIDGTNPEVENAVLEFNSYINQSSSITGEKVAELLNNYKKEVYSFISNSLSNISKLYLNNFVGEVSSAINSALDYEEVNVIEPSEDSFTPYIPEIPSIPEIEVEDTNDNEEVEYANVGEVEPATLYDIPQIPVVQVDVPTVETNAETVTNYEEPEVVINIPEVPTETIIENYEETENQTFAMDIPVINPIEPIQVVEEPVIQEEISVEPVKEEVKRTYDVDEILKIAKSPVVTMPISEEKKVSDNYLAVDPLKNEEPEFVNSEFNEKEIVEEMIRRLTKRLEAINERQAAYDEEKSKIEDDEVFVNNLIENSNNKKLELDKFEEELNNKESEITQKQEDLNKKLNDVLPFANAIMKEEKKEA